MGQPVIRGQQGARVAILQNSTSTADAANISADHAVSAEPILAESIEILRAPSTLLYGGGAIGGIVNIVDNRVPVSIQDGLSGALELRHDSVNSGNTAVMKLEGGVDKFAFHIDALDRGSSDVRVPVDSARIENTDTQTESYTLGGSNIFDNGYLGLAVNRLNNRYGVPAGAHVHEGDEDEDEEHGEHEEGEGFHGETEESILIDVEQTRYDLRGDWHELGNYVEKMRWFSTYTDYQHREMEGGELGTFYKNRTWENRLELVHTEYGGWHGALGFRVSNSDFSAAGEESFIPQSHIETAGVFLLEARLDYTADHFGGYISLIDARAQSKPGENEHRTDGFHRLDLGLDYRFDLKNGAETLVFFKARNLTDQEIRSSTSFLREIAPEPGRSIEAGVRLLF